MALQYRGIPVIEDASLLPKDPKYYKIFTPLTSLQKQAQNPFFRLFCPPEKEIVFRRLANTSNRHFVCFFNSDNFSYFVTKPGFLSGLNS